jgi:hypothetical protein
MNSLYGNKLNDLISNPGGFSGTPGYQFALDQGLQATQRGLSSQRGSGNQLAALMDRGIGMANQNYMDYAKLLGGLTGQEQQYDLGERGAANTADRNSNDFNLGLLNAQITGKRDWNNYDLGKEQNAMTSANNQNSFNLQTGGNKNQSFGGSTALPAGGIWKKWGY